MAPFVSGVDTLPPIASLVADWMEPENRKSFPIFQTAALSYAKRGWRVFPVNHDKRPITSHGRTDATTDPKQIETWGKRFPSALVAIATGEESGVVALDIDVTESINGFDSLEEIAGPFHPTTPTAHTPRGGCHLLFQHPGHFVKTVAGRLGPGLDIRGDGGSLTLPPRPGGAWDEHLGLDCKIACNNDPLRGGFRVQF